MWRGEQALVSHRFVGTTLGGALGSSSLVLADVFACTLVYLALVQAVRLWRTVDLRGYSHIEDRHLAAMFRRCTQARTIEVDQCPLVSAGLVRYACGGKLSALVPSPTQPSHPPFAVFGAATPSIRVYAS